MPEANRDTDRLYVFMAYACALIAFAGFTPTYWAPVASGKFSGHLPPLAFSLLPSFASDLLLIAAIAWDWRRRRRFDRTYLVAGACLVALQIIRVPLGPTTGWYEVTNWLLAFGS